MKYSNPSNLIHPRATRCICIALLSLLLTPLGSSGQIYSTIHNFTNGEAFGRSPCGRLAQGADGTIYGTTEYGGNYGSAYGGYGTVFKVQPDGSGFAILKHFDAGDGVQPVGGLELDGTTLYGTTYSLGPNGHGGTVFKLNTDGTGFQVLAAFNLGGSVGNGPWSAPLLAGQTLYGTTAWGGEDYAGCVYKVNTDGTGYQTLRSFPVGSNAVPAGRLVISGNTLYGTASCWPDFVDLETNYGCIFKINTDGSGYAALKAFTSGNDGARPFGGLVLVGSTLYGTTYYGGGTNALPGHAPWGYGTIFKIDTNGSNYTVLKRFGDEAAGPRSELVVCGSSLYGTTESGKDSFFGTIFRINTDGSGYTVIKALASGAEGADPWGPLLLSGTALYSTTLSGGSTSLSTSYGTVFSLSIAPPAFLTVPETQTAEQGATVEFSARGTNGPSSSPQWIFNGTNALDSALPWVLQITNVQYANAGAYTVVATNLFGSVTSPPATLSVIPPVPRRVVPALKLSGDAGSFLHLNWADTPGPGATWQELDALTLSATQQFYADLTLPLPAQRFYRAWQTGPGSVGPSLDLGMVPAITLTGIIGGSVRVDAINRFGPTDAWVTLDTVTLTNTTQFYFDFTMFRQPIRLYRLTPVP
jgi:uncharacterized repeat protein (TIGR03803 family)